MRRAKISLLLRLALSFALFPGMSGAFAAEALDRDAQRAEYRAARADLFAARLQSFERRAARLATYPLEPYLRYEYLLRYISRATPDQVTGFMSRYADTPLADRAYRHWLDNLARRGQWTLYREHYDPERAPNTRHECLHGRALLETGAREMAFSLARTLWLVDRSQVDDCDPLFNAWQRSGGIDDETAWARFVLVVEAGRAGLGSYLTRYLRAGDSRRLGEQMLALHRSPVRLRRLNSVGDGRWPVRETEVVSHTLMRLARRDAELAEAELARWHERLDLSADQSAAVRRAILREHAANDRVADLTALPWPPTEFGPTGTGSVPEGLVEDILRSVVSTQRWAEVPLWISRLAPHERQRLVWRYWSARAAEALATTPAEEDAARADYAALARDRSFYGFLAAHRLDVPVSISAASPVKAADALAGLRNEPALQRALELRAIGELGDGRRELAWLMQRLDDHELLVLATLLSEERWPRQSIQATIQGEHWDHVDLRFPLAYEAPLKRYAKARDLPAPWVFALTRQESAFMHDARSGAGAMGLMQLMPATARATARRYNIRLANSWQLIEAEKNLQLGTLYLRELYDRFDGNRVIAAAAYNAGPTRIDRWLRKRSPQPADVFIESIPFRETRRYVQNVLYFARVYAELLGEPHPFLTEQEQ